MIRTFEVLQSPKKINLLAVKSFCATNLECGSKQQEAAAFLSRRFPMNRAFVRRNVTPAFIVSNQTMVFKIVSKNFVCVFAFSLTEPGGQHTFRELLKPYYID